MNDDHYALLDSDCLRNKLGITDAEVLVQIEAKVVSVRELELVRATIPGSYNLSHLSKFHHALFRDIYDWAGQTRTVDISKGDSRFANWRYVDEQVSAVLNELASRDRLLGYKREAFLDSLAYFYGELNALHPFREGNGRCLRAFLRQLAAAAGYLLDWSELSASDNIEACRDNLLTADLGRLKSVLNPVVRAL